jgi:hypothetical protein
MRCSERVSLFTAYRHALKEHGRNVTKLQQKVRDIPQWEFQTAWRAAQGTREKCLEAQRLLQQHVMNHLC